MTSSPAVAGRRVCSLSARRDRYVRGRGPDTYEVLLFAEDREQGVDHGRRPL